MGLIKIWSVGILFLLLAGCGGNDSKNSVPLLSFNIPSEVAEGSLVTLASSSTDFGFQGSVSQALLARNSLLPMDP
tara:strand:- start:171 stop:398 length:228 start_codon:yes stop_codon:yes gene_type:complete